MSLDKKTAEILECALLISAGDAHIDESEEDSLNHHVGMLRRILQARKAIEFYENNGDIDGARELFDPKTPIVLNAHEMLFGLPRELSVLVNKRREVSSIEALSALERSTARKIKDPFLQKIALIVGEAIASADGEFSGAEQATWLNMANEWGLEYDEVNNWYRKHAHPVLNGEFIDEEISEDVEGDEDLDQMFSSLMRRALRIDFDEDEVVEDEIPEIFEIARSGGLLKFQNAWKRLSPVDPNAEHDGICLVGWAFSGEQLKIAKFLLDVGADANNRSSSGQTPLTLAIAMQNDEAVEVCLAAGADPELPSHHDATDLAGKSATLKVTPLSHAAQRDSADLVRVLINAGAVVDFRMANGHTALMSAAMTDATFAAKALLAAGANPDLEPAKKIKIAGWTPSTPLTCAARENSSEVAKLLIEAKVRVDVADGKGNTSLKLFARNGNDELVEALLAAGADPELTDNEGWGPLVSAAYRQHSSTVRLLLAAGSKPDIQTTCLVGFTPLIAAAKSGQADIVESLLGAGADVDLKNLAGEVALDVAIGAASAADDDDFDQLEGFERTIELLGGKVAVTEQAKKATSPPPAAAAEGRGFFATLFQVIFGKN